MTSRIVILLAFALTYTCADCNQYVFSVGRATAFTATTANAVIPFDIVTQNDFSVFDVATWSFTAPVDGMYSLAFSVASGKGYMKAFLHSSVDGNLATAVAANTNSQGAITINKELEMGTVVKVRLAAEGHETLGCIPECTTFSGHLLSENA